MTKVKKVKGKKKAKKGSGKPHARVAVAEDAPNMKVRIALMRQITRVVETKDWTQMEAAERVGITQPRINDLLRQRVNRFSLDALVNIAAALGRRVTVTMG